MPKQNTERKDSMNNKLLQFAVMLLAVVGVVLLFVLESKVFGLLCIVLAMLSVITMMNRKNKTGKDDDLTDRAAAMRDRFHRARQMEKDRN